MERLYLFPELTLSAERHLSAIPLKNNQLLLLLAGDDIEGTVEKTILEPGVILYCWNVKVLNSHRFLLEFENEDRAYMLVYFFEPPAEKVTFDIAGEEARFSKLKPFLMQYSNAKPIASFFPKACQLQCLSVSFSRTWLVRQLYSPKKEQATSDYLLQLVEDNHLRVLSKGEVILSQALFTELSGPAFAMEVKAHFYNLLTFLYRQVRISAFHDSKNQYQIILSKVEKRIMASLYTHLPPLNELAKEFYMSFSSLNRRFKDHYQMTIYDYYLEQKMQLAQQLLKEGAQPVNAVAFQLGYESVTHFISIFKKIHGYSPGQHKREKGEKE